MTMIDDLVDVLRLLPRAPAEIDGLPGRDLTAKVNNRGVVVLSAVRRDGADTDRDWPQPATLAELAECLDEAHRRLHDDDVAGAHHVLHVARTGWYETIRQSCRTATDSDSPAPSTTQTPS